MKNILIIGACGSGKTYVMRQLIEHLGAVKRFKIGTVSYASNGKTNILGKYDGTMFEGSDRLSMGVMKDVPDYIAYSKGKTTIAEGDRFTNKKYIELTQSTVIKILDTGDEGRKRRGSKQTERHVKAIATRVKNLEADYDVENSQECLELIKKLLKQEEQPNENDRN